MQHESPFAHVDVSAQELQRGALAAPRYTAVLDSISTHGAAIVTGAVDLAHCDALLAEDLGAATAKPFALDVPGHLHHNPPP
jgi:hypothetical protein